MCPPTKLFAESSLSSSVISPLSDDISQGNNKSSRRHLIPAMMDHHASTSPCPKCSSYCEKRSREEDDEDVQEKIIADHGNGEQNYSRRPFKRVRNVYDLQTSSSSSKSAQAEGSKRYHQRTKLKKITGCSKEGAELLKSAVIFGSSPDTVRLILQKHPEAASKIDPNGRTPLHFACICWQHSSFSVLEDTILYPREERAIDIVKVLCDASQFTVNHEDNEGVSALEYAIMSNMPLEAIKRIQKASVDEWRMREHHPELFHK